MKVKKTRSYSAYTIQALRLMGQQINFTRREKAMTEENLAERVGISRGTLRKIEEGNQKVEVGLVFEAAAVLGIPLFNSDKEKLAEKISNLNDKMALLPKIIRTKKKKVKDDF